MSTAPTSACAKRRKQLHNFGHVLETRFGVKQTRHIGFSAGDAMELKILNRTIKIDVQNDEMTLEADTKLVEDALKTIKLVGAQGVDSPRVRRNEEQTSPRVHHSFELRRK